MNNYWYMLIYGVVSHFCFLIRNSTHRKLGTSAVLAACLFW
jgi:hypothetical protein